MTRISIGDASLTSILRRQGAFLKGEVQRASTEVVTGKQSDLGAALRGDFSPLLAIDASLSRLTAYHSTTQDAAFQAQAMQTSMATLTSLSGEISATLMRSIDFPTPAQVNTAAADARGRLATAVGVLNAQTGGRSVFAGVETGRAPLGSAEDLLSALQTAATGATTAGQVESAVRGWFADPLGYAAFYQGGAGLSPIAIAPGETADLSVTALDPAIQETLTGFAMAALLDRGVLAGDHEARAELAHRAGLTLHVSQDQRTVLAARIGTVEAQIDAAKTRNTAEDSALKILRSDVGSVDPYEAASRLQTVQAQLESLYLITSRVSRLSLTEYIR
jgi:flagellar hook-associated protein 3 FlgL